MPITTNRNDLQIQLETVMEKQSNLAFSACSDYDCRECSDRRNMLDAEANRLGNAIRSLLAEEQQADLADRHEATQQRAMEFTAQTIADRINALATSQESSLNAGSLANSEAVAGQESLAAKTQTTQTNQERADTMKQDTRTTTERFIDAVNAMPEVATRRWSFEIESNDSGSATDELEALGMDAHNDGSVSTDCECDCGDCEHSCDCPNCSIANGYDSVDHCGDCLNNEFAPDNSHPVITSTWNGKIEQACDYIQGAGGRTDSDTGGHIHIDGTGLTPRKVATAIRIWRKVAELMPDFIGRGYCSFADEITEYELEAFDTLATYTGERYRAINANNLGGQFRGRADNYKNTLEFRQFAGTLDHRQIIARGFLCRAIVEMAISNSGIYYILRSTTAEQLLSELGLPTR